MLIRHTMIVAIVMISGIVAAQDNLALQTQKEKISYALGMDLGNQLRKLSVEADPALFGQGLKDALSGSKTLMTEQQVREAVSELQAELKRKEGAKMKGIGENDAETALLAAQNKMTGEAFLAANGKKEGVVTLPSGLQYKILKQGDGPKPALDATVICQYKAALLDGTEIFNTYTRQQPATLKVNGVIKGLTEALPLISVGSKWELFVPPALAYGELGSGPVRPNSTLKYEVELVSIK